MFTAQVHQQLHLSPKNTIIRIKLLLFITQPCCFVFVICSSMNPFAGTDDDSDSDVEINSSSNNNHTTRPIQQSDISISSTYQNNRQSFDFSTLHRYKQFLVLIQQEPETKPFRFCLFEYVLYTLATKLRQFFKQQHTSQIDIQNKDNSNNVESRDMKTRDSYSVTCLKQLLIVSLLHDSEMLDVFLNSNSISGDSHHRNDILPELKLLREHHMPNISFCEDFNYLFLKFLPSIITSNFLQTLSYQTELREKWLHVIIQEYCSFLSGIVPVPPYVLWNRLQLQQHFKKVVYNIVESILTSSPPPTTDHLTTGSQCEEHFETEKFFKKLPASLRIELQDLDEDLCKLVKQ
jgi:hypothetical protein